MLLRRELLEKVATGAVAAAALTVVGAGVAATGRPPTEAEVPPGPREAATGGAEATAPAAAAEATAVPAAPPPWELLRPLAVGTTVAPGWRLVDLSPVRDGACVVTLGTARGRVRRIHLCRNDGAPQGLIHTRRVDLVVMNDGHGELPTEEPLAQAVAAVARTIAANEAHLSDGVLGELLAHHERVQRYAVADGTLAAGKLR